jgi:hypothetical protein
MGRFFRDWNEVITEDEARSVTGPYLALLRSCIEDGVRKVEDREKKDPDFFHVYPSGARATITFWQIVDVAEARFRELDGVSVSHNRGFLTILINDKIELRFKKLDKRMQSRNFPTRRQVVYQLQLRLVGMDEPTRATAGYQLNLDGTLKDVLVVCPRGNRIEWSFSIPVDGESIIAHPEVQIPPSDEDKPKVRPKQA